MTLLYALPYNRSVEGFFFQTIDQYRQSAEGLTDSFGQPVEEFEIQFIDGGQIDCELFEAWRVSQASLAAYLEAVDGWRLEHKMIFIIAVSSCGYAAHEVADDPERIELDIYHVDSLRELAEQFVDEGLFGDIPDRLQPYLDYDAIARDLGIDGYDEVIVAGERLVYRCG